jgi:predicted nucleic acid-binding protein
MKALDTNVILFHTLKDSKFEKRASEIIGKIDKGEEIFIPLPVLKETLFALHRRGKNLREILEIFAPFQKDNVKIVEDDFNTFIRGLEIADKYKIGPTDGVIASTMLEHGIKEIYSNDPDFDKVPGIKRVF